MRKNRRLRTVFIKYLGMFCVMTVVLIAALFYGFMLALSTGAVLPANEMEQLVAQAKDRIVASEVVTPALIPAGCSYGVFSPDGTYQAGDLSPEEASTAWATANDTMPAGNPYFYARIDRVDEVCVVRYRIASGYASAWANEHLPSPVLLFLAAFLLCFLGGTALLASHFGRRLSGKLAGLNEATQRIREQDLDFETEPSGVQEIDAVLDSMNQMRRALKTSLEKQWDMENARKQQLSALAHDIKAPVTVIRGNAELLSETQHTDEQSTYLLYIQDSASQLERYVRQMIEVSRAQDVMTVHVQPVRTQELLGTLAKELRRLASAKQISVEVGAGNLPETVLIDQELFLRAFQNVAANAIEHTPIGGSVLLGIKTTTHEVHFTITDDGPGFTADELHHATEEFFMGDKGRTPGEHYGMGLYIASTILRQHNGWIALENASNGGGCVTLAIRI